MIAIIAAVSVACGPEFDPSAETRPIRIALVDPGCRLPDESQDDPPRTFSARVTLRSDDAVDDKLLDESKCIELRGASDLTAMQTALHDADVGFADLGTQEVILKVEGFETSGCGGPITRCGAKRLALSASTATADSEDETAEIELPLHCWADADALAYNICVDGEDNRVVDAQMNAGTWTPSASSGNPILQIAADSGRSPPRSLHIRADPPEASSSASWSSALFSVLPGQAHEVGVWALPHFEETQGGLGITVQILWYSVGLQELDTVRETFSDELTPDDWQHLKRSVTTPADVSYARIVLSTDMQFSAEVWFDDAGLF